MQRLLNIFDTHQQPNPEYPKNPLNPGKIPTNYPSHKPPNPEHPEHPLNPGA
jgi:hypothetical protein